MQKDRGLQDRFAEFGAQPSEQVWTKLETDLKGKKKRRAALLWWTGLSFGVISILLVFLFVKTLPSTNDLKVSKVLAVEQENVAKNRSQKEKGETGTTFEKNSISKPNKEVDENKNDLSKFYLNSNFRKEEQALLKKIITPEYGVHPDIEVGNIVEVVDLNLSPKDSLPRKKREVELKRDDFYNLAIKSVNDSINQEPKVLRTYKDTTKAADSIIKKDEVNLTPLVAENKSNSQPQRGNWSFGLFVGRAQSIRADEATEAINTGGFQSDLTNMEVVNYMYYNKETNYNKVLSVELNASYTWRKRWRLRAGLGYEKYNRIVVSELASLNSNTFYTKTFYQSTQLNYAFLQKRKIEAYLGLGYNNAFSSTIAQSLSESYVGSVQIQTGVRLNLSEQWALDLQPYLQRFNYWGKTNGLYRNSLLGASFGVVFTPNLK